MRKCRKAIRTIFLYLLLTGGVYMFLQSCSNSYNRMAEEKIAPASIVISGKKASVSILESKMSFSTEIFSPESKFYLISYLVSPDDVRSMAYFLTLIDSKA